MIDSYLFFDDDESLSSVFFCFFFLPKNKKARSLSLSCAGDANPDIGVDKLRVIRAVDNSRVMKCWLQNMIV